MDLSESLTCPKCQSNNLEVKRKVTYIYTYKINDENRESGIERKEELPFLFDNREKSGSDEYIICENCGTKYPIDLEHQDTKINFTILRKAIRADHVENPQFLG
jgi:uncharacterized protein YbaR (Trm112 family)